MGKFSESEVESFFHSYGLFASRHPVSMILFTAIMVFSCCYPLLNLPLPGREPILFHSSKEVNVLNQFGNPTIKKPSPHFSWFSSENKVAYIQQFIFKSTMTCTPEKQNSETLKKFFSLTFDVISKLNSMLNMSSCFDISKRRVKLDKKSLTIFPNIGCLITSPALFWNNNKDAFLKDGNVIRTITQHSENPSEPSKTIREIYFGVSKKFTGITQCDSTDENFCSFAVTLVLDKYDKNMINEIYKNLLHSFSTPEMTSQIVCNNTTKSKNLFCNKQGRLTHVYFKRQIQFKDLVPLVSTYFVLGCYIYFSVRKINFVKSKIGMAFSAVVSVMASLMMAVGICSMTGLAPIQNGGEIFPYLVCIIGLENILVITKSVVATPVHMEVEKRIALGLKREGCSITKNILMEFVLIGIGYLTFIPEIQEFCAFAFVGVLSDFLMHMMFFVTVLSIDIRRLDPGEMYYPVTIPENDVYNGDAFSQKKHEDEVVCLENGGKHITILKIPKRLRVVFFFADTRMVQRGLMVIMLIWFACSVYSDPMHSWSSAQQNVNNKYAYDVNEEMQKFNLPQMTDVTEFYTDKIKWTRDDMYSFMHLRFTHWPTLFAYYNVTLANKFVSILPNLLVPVKIKEENINSNLSKHGDEGYRSGNESKPYPADQHVNDNVNQLSSDYEGEYQMTGLDYYLTLLLGAISGMLMVFVLNIMYRCVCSRNYANWRSNRQQKTSTEPGSHISSVGETLPLLLSDHNQLVEFVHADDFMIASADISGVLKTWDYQTGELLSTIDRQKNTFPDSPTKTQFTIKELDSNLVSSIWCLTSCKQLLIAGCDDGCIEIWNYFTSEFKCCHKSPKGGVVGVALEFPSLAAARISGSIDIFQIDGSNINAPTVQHRGTSRTQTSIDCDVLSLQLIYSISAHQQPITQFKVSMGRILTGSSDHTLKLFTIHDAKCQYTMAGHTGPITCVCMDKGSPAGAVSGSADGTVRLWDLLTGSCLHKLEEHKEPITSVECSPNHVVSNALDGKMCIWSRRTGFLLQIIKLDVRFPAPMTMLGKKMCVTGGLGEVLLWDIRKGELLQRIELHSGSLLRHPVNSLYCVANLSVVCSLGRELRIINFPSVMEKSE